MAAVRDQVTDLIFRAGGIAPQQRSAYRETAAVHEETGGYGVAENIAATSQAVAPPQAPEAGGDGQGKAGGEVAVRVKTIIRDEPKVGRNDPCPCGSGKKYKKCHGANVV
jgi:preprotein translocase subunit SecA